VGAKRLQVVQRRWLTTRGGLNGLGRLGRCVNSVCRLGEVQSCGTMLQVSWGGGECWWAALLQAKRGWDGSPGGAMLVIEGRASIGREGRRSEVGDLKQNRQDLAMPQR